MVADVFQTQVQTQEEEVPDQEVIIARDVVQVQTQIPALQEEVLLQ